MTEKSPFQSQIRIKEETKDKFDILLKRALITKSHKDAQNRAVHDIETVSSSSIDSENVPDNSNLPVNKQSETLEIVEVDIHNTNHNENFILNKFLNDSTNMTVVKKALAEQSTPDDVFIKPPVPRPRQKIKSNITYSRSSSISSTGTYNITSPTVVPNVDGVSLIENKSAKKDNDHEIIKTDSTESVSSISSRKFKKTITQTEDIEQKSTTSLNYSESSNHSSLNTDVIKYENETQTKRKIRKKTTTPHIKQKDIKVLSEKKYDYTKIVAITIHKTDPLKLDSLVIHPVVKVHLVNAETGEYIRKSDQNRPVVFFYENKDIPYITPVISEAYSLYEKCSLYPAWEETLIINEDINYISEENNCPIVFFEIMDFVSFSTASSQFHQKDSSKGWHKIAWAFLKLLGKGGSYNTEKRARLQLYYPGKHKKVISSTCDIFHWWKGKKLVKYPSSLLVTVKGMIPPEKIIETLRSKTPMCGEKGSRIDFELEPAHRNQNSLLNKFSDKKNDQDVVIEKDTTSWSKLQSQTCKFPNSLKAELDSYEEGCLLTKFSNNGLYLACSVSINGMYSIVIYSVATYDELWSYSAHQCLIYSISWSKNDEFIITASADCTVCIWNFIKHTFNQMLPHPTYVYAGVISSRNIIATGCYDQTIRIWISSTTDSKVYYDLHQELEGHNGYITSLCFNSKSSLLYSSDSLGIIIEWKQNDSDLGDNIWNLKREFKLIDLRGTIINQVLLHRRERRLLIHARDSIIRVVDLKTTCISHWLQGSLNNRFQTLCSFSACGTYIYAGSENGYIYVWNLDTGQVVANYTPYQSLKYNNFPIHCVQFHPHDNILAVSHYGHSVPILLITYDPMLCEKDNIGLNLLNNEDGVSNKKSKIKKVIEATETVVTDSGESGIQRKGKLKLEDVIQKIDTIIISKPINSDMSSKSSTINNN